MLIDCTNAYFKDVWIWLTFPFAGAILAGLVGEWFLREGSDPKAEVAAEVDVTLSASLRETGDAYVPVEAPEVEIEVEGGLDVDVGTGAGFMLTGNIEAEVDVDAEVEVEVEVPEIAVEAEVGLDIDVEVDLEAPEFAIAIEADVDWNAWGDAPENKAPWAGFYVQGGEQQDMNFDDMQIGFDGAITGAGNDVNGGFTIEGSMNGDATFAFTKTYDSGTAVAYNGAIDNGKMVGNWSLPDQPEESFEISLAAQPWSGFFEQGGEKNQMALNLSVTDAGVFGSGNDTVGVFVCRGTVEGDQVKFAKKYLGQHEVLYSGTSSGNQIKGAWSIPGNCDGKFVLTQG